VIYLLDRSALGRIRTSDVVAQALRPLYAACVVATCTAIDLQAGCSARDAAHYRRIARAQHRVVRLSMGLDVQLRALHVQERLARAARRRDITPAHLLIAACAEIHGATLLHYDRAFDHIAGVTGQPSLWVAPPGSVP